MRFITALALFIAVVAAVPKGDGSGNALVVGACTVDCTCLNANKNRSWPDTQRCCVPNGGTLDTEFEYCRRISIETAEQGYGACCGGGGWFECRTQICDEQIEA